MTNMSCALKHFVHVRLFGVMLLQDDRQRCKIRQCDFCYDFSFFVIVSVIVNVDYTEFKPLLSVKQRNHSVVSCT